MNSNRRWALHRHHEMKVICFSTKPQQRRFLIPVAAAGGWPVEADKRARMDGAVAVVCCYADERRALQLGAVGTVLMEHGLGQCYAGLPAESPWTAGRGQQPHRRALLVPGPYAAAQHGHASRCPVLGVGSPFLDWWHGRAPARQAVGVIDRRPVVCISTHWDCHVCPETRSAWPWIVDQLPALAGDPRWRLLGHYHPHEAQTGTLTERLRAYRAAGVEIVDSWEEVMSRSDLYICDNSSSLYEFAALDRPVVVLSPPWYRRHVTHGLRFWSSLPGLEVTQPEHLIATVAAALADEDGSGHRLRAAANPLAWGPLDGHAAERAASVIHRFVF